MISSHHAKAMVASVLRLRVPTSSTSFWPFPVAVVWTLFVTSIATTVHARGTRDPDQLPPLHTQQSVSFGVWVGALTELLDTTPTPGLDEEYQAFVVAHHLPSPDPTLKRDYRRLRLLFEAARDGGFWHLRWGITDRYPSSRQIWQSWIKSPVRQAFAEPSATAECDELSALVGMLARQLAVKNVGLFYPTWNHTIAVWAPLEGKTQSALIQLPTTQVFLECSAGFDNTTFRTRLKNIERYPNLDLGKNDALPQPRANWLLQQIQMYAEASPALWALMRAKRAFAMASSMGECRAARALWYRELSAHTNDADLRVLTALAERELAQAHPNPRETLSWLSEP